MKLLALPVVFALISGCAPIGDQQFDTGSPRPVILYIADNFDGARFNPQWSAARVNEETYQQHGQPAFVKMEGHGDVLHYYKAKDTDEESPAFVSIEGEADFQRLTGRPSPDELYVEWSELFPRDHSFAVIGQKLMRLNYNNEGDKGLEVTWAVLNRNSRTQLFLWHPRGTSGGSSLDLGIDAAPIPIDRWVRCGVWVRMNTPGQSDGFVRVYLDGSPIISRAHVSLRGKDKHGWNLLWVGGNYSNGPGKTEPKESHRYIDDVKVYSTKPRVSEPGD